MSFPFSIYPYQFEWPGIEQGLPYDIQLTQQNSYQDVIIHLQQQFGLICQLYTADLQLLDPSAMPYQQGIAQVYAVQGGEEQQQIQVLVVQDMTTQIAQLPVPLGTNLQQVIESFQGQYQYLSIQLLDSNQQPISNEENYILNDPDGYILSLNTKPQFKQPAQSPFPQPVQQSIQNPPPLQNQQLNQLNSQSQQQSKGNQVVEQEAIKRLELFKIINNVCIAADPNGKFVVYKFHSMKSFIQGILYEFKGVQSKKFASNNNFEKLGPISFLENGDGIVIKWADGRFSSIRIEQRG